MSQHDLPELRLVAHHVGARGFGVSFNVPEGFRSDVVHVLYEADAECVARMLETEKASEHAKMLAERHVLPYCLGRRPASASLHVTANSYASSVLAPDPKFFRNYCEIQIEGAAYDVLYGEMLKVVRKVEVKIHSIDQLFAEGKIPVPALPDFLSVDTQGYEFEILEGASKTISQSVLGIVCEVEMQPMYTAQPLLGDILGHLGRNGFIFAGFTDYYEISPYRAAIGLRGKAFPGFGDALFLRDIDGMTEERFGAKRLYVMLTKLAFIAVSYGHIEYALYALQAAASLRPKADRKILDAMNALQYPRFLGELAAAAAKHEVLFAPIHAVPDDSRPKGDTRTSWYDKHHKAALKRFHEIAARAGGGRVSAPIATAPSLAPAQASAMPLPRGMLPPKLRSMLGRIARRFLPKGVADALRRAVTPQVVYAPPSPPGAAEPSPGPPAAVAPSDAHPWSAIKPQTDFEDLLERWGFPGPAHLVRQRRIAAERYVRTLDKEMYRDGAQTHLPRG